MSLGGLECQFEWVIQSNRGERPLVFYTVKITDFGLSKARFRAANARAPALRATLFLDSFEGGDGPLMYFLPRFRVAFFTCRSPWIGGLEAPHEHMASSAWECHQEPLYGIVLVD